MIKSKALALVLLAVILPFNVHGQEKDCEKCKEELQNKVSDIIAYLRNNTPTDFFQMKGAPFTNCKFYFISNRMDFKDPTCIEKTDQGFKMTTTYEVPQINWNCQLSLPTDLKAVEQFAEENMKKLDEAARSCPSFSTPETIPALLPVRESTNYCEKLPKESSNGNQVNGEVSFDLFFPLVQDTFVLESDKVTEISRQRNFTFEPVTGYFCNNKNNPDRSFKNACNCLVQREFFGNMYNSYILPYFPCLGEYQKKRKHNNPACS